MKKRLAYLGPAGTYTEQAAMSHDPTAILIPCSSIPAVAAAVANARQSLGDPAGVAKILTFLASDDADYVRGTIFTR